MSFFASCFFNQLVVVFNLASWKPDIHFYGGCKDYGITHTCIQILSTSSMHVRTINVMHIPINNKANGQYDNDDSNHKQNQENRWNQVALALLLFSSTVLSCVRHSLQFI